MELTAQDIQTCILLAMKRADPEPQTDWKMAKNLEWFVGHIHRVAIRVRGQKAMTPGKPDFVAQRLLGSK